MNFMAKSVALIAALALVHVQGTMGIKTFSYWGQGNNVDTTGPRAELPLAQACTHYDVIMLAFLPNFGREQDLTQTQNVINLSFHGNPANTQAGILSCQAAGKPVILSIGGANGNYGFDSAADAQNTAQQIWNIYLGGSSPTRPFGTAKLDGVDLDIEQTYGSQYYANFVTELKSLYATDSGKKYYLTAVPQCPYPDANLGQVLSSDTSSFDYVLIQFYDNPPCDYANSDSAVIAAYKQWTGLIPAPKLVPTFPASAIYPGYTSASNTAQTLKDLNTPNWGVWAVAYDQNNGPAGPGVSPFWSEQVRSDLGGANPTPPSTPSPGPTPSPPSVPSPASPLPPTSSSGCPTGAANDPFCNGKPQFNPNPCDCAKFVQCVNGQSYIQACGAGTYWSASSNTCVSGTCTTSGTSPSSSPTPAPTTPAPTTPAPTTPAPTTPAPSGSCPTGAAGDTFCRGKTGQFYADPCDNTKFVQCSNGITYLQSCGAGTVWSQSSTACVFASG